MESKYIAYHFKIEPKEPGTEILLAELGELAFDSFVETEEGLSAYIQEEFLTSDILDNIFILKNPEFKITYQTENIAQVNWNEEWRSEERRVGKECMTRGLPAHRKKNTTS